MNKSEFITHIAKQHNCTKVEAERVINMFVDGTIGALAASNEISLIGFGHFSVREVPARAGRNPQTGKAIQIAAYKQPKFRVGQKLKDACNSSS